MSTRTVNGTSIQAAIDASAPDDIVSVAAGGYAEFTISKRVKVVASGSPPLVQRSTPGDIIRITAAGATLQGFEALGATGPTSAAVAVINVPDVILTSVKAGDAIYAIRAYGAPTVRLTATDCQVHHASHGLNFHAGGSGSVVTRLTGWDMDKMTVNDPVGGNDTGGMFVSLYRTNGLIKLIDATSDRAYSIVRGTTPASYDYNWDGAHIELYESGPLDVSGGTFRGSPVFMESGKGTSGANCGVLTVKNAKIHGTWSTPEVLSTDAANRRFYHANIGFLFRSMLGALIENCQFRFMDHHTYLLERSGNYATGAILDGIVSRNNQFWLKPTADQGGRYLTIGANVPTLATTFNSYDERIYTVPGTTVASVQGKGTSNDLATIRSWAPTGATWLGGSSSIGPEVIVPVETPLQVAIRERDEARALLAASQSAHAAALATLVTRTAERDAAVAGWNSAESARAVAEAGRIASVADAAKVRAAVDVAAAV